MSDLIDRQALIEEYDRVHVGEPGGARKLICDAPTVEERKTGKWIEDGYTHYKAVCSECGEPCATYVMDAPRDRFCKWCGADMRQRGEHDGER